MYEVVKNLILKGLLTHRSQLPEECRQFWSVRQHLTVDDDRFVYGCRLLILLEMCHQTLAHLQEVHQEADVLNSKRDSSSTGQVLTMTSTT